MSNDLAISTLAKRQTETSMRMWFTWENQVRNIGLAKAFDCSLELVDHNSHPRLIRNILSIFSTLSTLFKHKPSHVFAQSPSLILAALMSLVKVVRRKNMTLVLDLHNSSVEALRHENYFKRYLAHFSCAKADYLIVTNRGLLGDLEEFSEKAIILPDRLPHIPLSQTTVSPNQQLLITVVASYAEDEPIEEILIALDSCDFPLRAHVTGSRSKAQSFIKYESEVIHFTGYLAIEDYHHLLSKSDLIIDLTHRENCLVCGAYESLSINTPSLLSDTQVNREVFPRGSLFTKNDAESIAQALQEFNTKASSIKNEAREYRPQFEEVWNRQFRAAQQQIFQDK